jgi:hypothetical protein
MACIWNKNSLPARLAGSPVQLSSVPNTSVADAHMVQYFAYIAGYFLRPFIKTTGTAYPKQYFGFFAFGGHFGHGWYLLVISIILLRLSWL